MSHASCIVALSPAEIESAGSVENAVEFQMKPFDEKSEWFAEGSRWDWYSIGGRYSGKFAPAWYDPQSDKRNFELCCVCSGTGMRMDAIGIEHRQRDPDYKCNGCHGRGQKLMFPTSWVDVGNICLRSDLSEADLKERRRAVAIRLWAAWEGSKDKSPETRSFLYGLSQQDTQESLIAEYEESYLTAFAFLSGRRWCENFRVGWFATPAKTECSIKAEKSGEHYEGRCLFTNELEGARIVTWEEDEKTWQRLYWPRFVRNLSPQTTLVVVDYHV